MAGRTVVVAEAPDPVQAGIWVDALRQAGVAAATFERGAGAALGGAATPGFAAYPIIVSTTDLGAARSVIAELAGAAVLAPYRDGRETRGAQRLALLAVGAVIIAGLLMAVAARLAGY